MILKKIISGGQTGVDQAALRAAKASGLATGGWMPLGYRTLTGPRPDIAELYGMREHESIDYPPRTSANVRESDATLRIAVDFDSAGEKCTMSAIRRHKKPYTDVVLIGDENRGYAAGAFIEEIVRWIVEKNIVVLNVAGNSERTAPGIGAFAEKYLASLFVCLRDG